MEYSGPRTQEPGRNLQKIMTDRNTLQRLAETITARKQADPAGSYVARLLHSGEDAILRKLTEEATETLLASKEGDRQHVIRETADLWFHSLVLLAWHDISLDEVLAEFERREGLSGLAEKASRTTQTE